MQMRHNETQMWAFTALRESTVGANQSIGLTFIRSLDKQCSMPLLRFQFAAFYLRLELAELVDRENINLFLAWLNCFSENLMHAVILTMIYLVF